MNEPKTKWIVNNNSLVAFSKLACWCKLIENLQSLLCVFVWSVSVLWGNFVCVKRNTFLVAISVIVVWRLWSHFVNSCVCRWPLNVRWQTAGDRTLKTLDRVWIRAQHSLNRVSWVVTWQMIWGLYTWTQHSRPVMGWLLPCVPCRAMWEGFTSTLLWVERHILVKKNLFSLIHNLGIYFLLLNLHIFWIKDVLVSKEAKQILCQCNGVVSFLSYTIGGDTSFASSLTAQ